MSGATGYEVRRETTPYFTPRESGSVELVTTMAVTSQTDPGRVGDPHTNFYYLIVVLANDCPTGVS
ncbi:MAG: hypothetical protein CVU38_20990, partial [Chloroflexi bacterium HGW-Chloroflexi-1]